MKPTTQKGWGLAALAVIAAASLAGPAGAAQPNQVQPPCELGVWATPTPQGMYVTRVAAGSKAARIGLEPGDVIVAINGWRMRTPANMRWAIANSGGVLQLVIRDGRRPGRIVVRSVDLTEPDEIYFGR